MLTPMNLKSAFLAAALLATPAALHAQQPDAQKILEGARLSAKLVDLPDGLSGNLVGGGRRVPVNLFLKGGDIQFNFSEVNGQWQIFHMRLGDKAAELFDMTGGKQAKFPPSRLGQAIGGTDLTYEDLSMSFLYWPNPVLEGTERVGAHTCFKLRLQKPRGAGGRYETVHVWVHTTQGAFMRVRGYDAGGGLIKEFQVNDIMQVGPGVWTLRRMQVATHDPRSGRRQSLTNVTFDTPRQIGNARRGGR
jgi:hypothetical protein